MKLICNGFPVVVVMFKTAFFSLCFSLASIFFACLVSFKTVPVFAADAYSERILEPAVVLSVQNDPALSEVSGVATSHFNRGYIWAINDSGNEPSLHLVSESGANRIEVNLDHLANYDWEDLDSFVVEGQPYLLIADVGDNLQRRKVYYLHLMPEPRLSPSQPTQHHTASNQIKTIGFQYEDGARDCEAVAVDVANKKI